MSKTVSISIRMSEEQKETIKKAAKLESRSFNAHVLRVALEYSKKCIEEGNSNEK